MIIGLSFFLIFIISLLYPQIQIPSPAPLVPLVANIISEMPTLEKETTLLAVGDIMLGRYCNVTMESKNSWQYPFLATADLTTKADLAFANLEAPFVKDCPKTSSGMIFCAPPQSIEGLSFGGFDVVSLANNHILNYGQEGLNQTKELLAQNQISDTTFQELTVKTVNGVSFGFLAFDLVTYPKTDVLAKVKENKNLVDVLIVSLHWGAEYQPQPNDDQTLLAHLLVDNGVKVVLGHHPHVTQPVEEYNGGLIFYSLGNFVFDQPWSEETKKGEIAEITFNGNEIKSYLLTPIYIQDYCQPQLIN